MLAIHVLSAMVATAIVAFLSGFQLSRSFCNHERTDKSGESDGMLMALLSGYFCGSAFALTMMWWDLFSPLATFASLMTAFVIGVLANIVGVLSGSADRRKRDDEKGDQSHSG